MLNRSYIIAISFLLIFLLIAPESRADEYTTNPGFYLLDKFKTHDIVFLGNTHKRPLILNFISDLIPTLRKAGVSHICLEIHTDQQNNIDHYIQTGEGLSEIKLEHPIDCPEYRSLFKTIRNLPQDKSVAPKAIDLPRSRYEEDISRDEYMAQSIAKLYKDNLGIKMLVVIGSLHTLKKLDWEDQVINKKKSIREYLTNLCPGIRMFSIAQVIDKNPEECDFTKTFAPIDSAVAFDCTQRFAGWKLGTLSAIAIQETEAYEAFDGLIVY